MAIAETADILVVVGTSLAVYPAASLATCVPATAKCYLVNPKIPSHFDADGDNPHIQWLKANQIRLQIDIVTGIGNTTLFEQ